MFVGSEKGGKSAATLLSLIQMCPHLKINHRKYMENMVRMMMDHPASGLEEFLPNK